MARRLIYFGDATEPIDAPVWIRRMRFQLRASQGFVAGVLAIGVVLALTTVDTPLLLVFGAVLVANLVVVEVALRRLRADNFVAVAVTFALVLWATVLVAAALVPFALPILVLTVLVALLGTAPLLERHEVGPFIGAGAAMATATALLAVWIDSPIDHQLPERLRDLLVVAGVAALTVPMGFLAWDTHVRHAVGILRLVEANDALRASRSRLVEVADQERRQLERDLHDGAQQRLVGLAMRLRLVGVRHPEMADEVDGLVDEVQSAIDELRELAHGIYPPLLERRGLGEALTAAARRSTVDARVEATGTGRYPQAVETAVYFCCLEALQNAAKHAGTNATVTVSLSEVDDLLELAIHDDGHGFDPESAGAGRGLRNMADRLAAVDADLRIASAPGAGVRMSAAIPVPGAATVGGACTPDS